MSFEMPGDKSKSAQKDSNNPSSPGGFVVQVSGSTTSGMGKIKQSEGAPIEITSKLNADRSDDVVSFDNTQTSGVMTVATIKPTQKQVSDSAVIQMSNIQRASAASDHRPILTKQKQKIISSQDRPKVFTNKGTNNEQQKTGGAELFQRQPEPLRNQTSCNNRTSVLKSQQDKKQSSNQNFASVILAQGERKSKAISQLARNSNMH